MRSVLVLVICGLLVGGCQNASGSNGKGPITLSWQAMAKFGVYENEWSPFYFVLSDDGKSSTYTYCPAAAKDCYDDAAVQSVEICNRYAERRGAKCFLFASDQQIVWKGPISYGDFNSDYLFAYVIEVAGGKRAYFGKGNLVDGGRKITISADQCRGEADLNTKEWFLKGCKNDDYFSGTFISGEGLAKFRGIGRGQSKGASVDMVILDPSSDPRFSKAKV